MQGDLFQSPLSVSAPKTGAWDPKKGDSLSSFKLTLRLDHLIVIQIVGLILFAVVYSFGVEKGKTLAVVKVVVPPTAAPSPQLAPTDENPEGTPPLSSIAPMKKDADGPPAGAFTIQMITYKQGSAAKRLMNELSQKGHRPFVIPSGSYIQVCLDGYESREQAVKALRGLKISGVVPKDAFVRPIPH